MTADAWALAQHRTTEGVATGIHANGRTFEAPPTFRHLSVMQLLQDWARWSEELRGIDPASLQPIQHAALIAPLTYPNKLICAGANYYDHAEEMGVERPDPAVDPFFFLKAPTTTVVGPDEAVAISAGENAQVDWEAELGVVIGHTCANVDPSEAFNVIAGYVVANDISDRGVFAREGAVSEAFAWDWVAHKGQDGFCPLGPGVVPAWLVPDPQDLRIRLDVNGIVKQDSNTSLMVVGVPQLVAAASRLMKLEPGDVILTGTPAGVGLPRKDFLRPADVVTAEVEGIGRISTPLVGK
jgi:2-keto-4-pentenoate hydratase/2-oxohepta-3-ene-1,7-dioic acid hydratase in catechol pathway